MLLMLSLMTLSSCAGSYNEPPPPHTNPISFAAQRYPTQTDQCTGEVQSERGTIQWASATSIDPIINTVQYYNRKTGIAKRRTKKDEHLWVMVQTGNEPRHSLAVMSLTKAQHLKLLCSNPIPQKAQSAIIVSSFKPKPLPIPDYKHAAP